MQLIALKTRSAAATNSAGLIFFPLLFLTPNFVPRDLLTRPMEIAATFNPVTYVMEALRSLILEDLAWETIGLGFLVVAVVGRGHARAQRPRDPATTTERPVRHLRGDGTAAGPQRLALRGEFLEPDTGSRPPPRIHDLARSQAIQARPALREELLRMTQQGRQDSNLQPPVLETGALPIELRPWVARIVALHFGHPPAMTDMPMEDMDRTQQDREDDTDDLLDEAAGQGLRRRRRRAGRRAARGLGWARADGAHSAFFSSRSPLR